MVLTFEAFFFCRSAALSRLIVDAAFVQSSERHLCLFLHIDPPCRARDWNHDSLILSRFPCASSFHVDFPSFSLSPSW
jgi:hypothetical protein